MGMENILSEGIKKERKERFKMHRRYGTYRQRPKVMEVLKLLRKLTNQLDALDSHDRRSLARIIDRSWDKLQGKDIELPDIIEHNVCELTKWFTTLTLELSTRGKDFPKKWGREHD